MLKKALHLRNKILTQGETKMEFKEFLSEAEKSMSESAQIKLDLITQINSLMGAAEIGDLKKIVKILEKASEE